MNGKTKRQKSKKSLKSQRLATGVLVVILLLLGAGGLYWHHLKAQPVSGTIKATVLATSKAEPKSTSKTSKSSTATSSQPSTPTSTKTVASSTTPTTSSGTFNTPPSGTFVSNHEPTLTGSLSQEESTCNTLPGATCYIQFTALSNGAIKTLSAQVANSDGSVIWSWNVGSSGFTAGSWKIVAFASLNGQTTSTQDSMNLEVQQ